MKNLQMAIVSLGVSLVIMGSCMHGNPGQNLEGWIENNSGVSVTVTGIGKYILNPFSLESGKSGMFNFLWWWDFSYNPSPTSLTDWKRGARVDFVGGKYSSFEVWFEGFRGEDRFRHIRAWVGGNPKVISQRADITSAPEEVIFEKEGIKVSIRWVPYSWAIADVKFVITKI